jgi:hypothetical protein
MRMNFRFTWVFLNFGFKNTKGFWIVGLPFVTIWKWKPL